MASFLCTKGDGSLVKDVILYNDQMVQLSCVDDYECIRCLICIFSGWCCTYLLDSSPLRNSNSSSVSSTITSSSSHVNRKVRSKSMEEDYDDHDNTSLVFLTGVYKKETNEKDTSDDFILFSEGEAKPSQMPTSRNRISQYGETWGD